MPFNEPTTFATGSEDSYIRLYDLRFSGIVGTFYDKSAEE
jgi:hypothetical protein